MAHIFISPETPTFQSGIFPNAETVICGKSRLKLCKNLIQHKPNGEPVYDFIQKKRNVDKSAKEAMIDDINKLLRVYYGKIMALYLLLPNPLEIKKLGGRKF